MAGIVAHSPCRQHLRVGAGYGGAQLLEIEFIKLLLGTFAFVLIGWFGAADKRIGGVLLTFPLLNGIAMLTGADPLGIAGTIYLVVIWNCLLFLYAIRHYESLPPLPASLNAEARIVLRVVVWIVLWALGATALAWLRDVLSNATVLFVIAAAITGLYVWRRWNSPSTAPSPTFRGMWLNGRGILRIMCFVLAFAVLSLVTYLEKDSRWIGWAGSLPLPGLFALAMLSATQSRQELRSLGDTVLLGPLLVIPFNGLLARAIIALRAAQSGTAAEIAVVIIAWVIAAGLVFGLVPAFSRWRDRRIAFMSQSHC
jgi:hypothetical protein